MSTCRTAIIAGMLLMPLFPAAMAGDEPAARSGEIRVFVSILPQAYFVERIAAGHVDVSVLVGPGQSPATYDPSPKEMARLSVAGIYFIIGVPFEEHLLDRITRMMPNLNIVDTRTGIQFRHMDPHHDLDNHSHQRGAPDPHVWLDPSLVKTQARTICDELKRIDSSSAGLFEQNLAIFQRELDSLDSAIDSLLAPYAGRHMYVFHPSYGYFADRYSLVQVAVETEGKEPGARSLGELIRQAQSDGARAIFVQPQFATKTAEAIARELNVDVVLLDPLARDYVNNLMEIAQKIAASLSANSNTRGGEDGS